MAKKPVIALLGGGQLGRMFIENALRYNAVIHVLDPDPDAPCSTIADRFLTGDLNDRNTILAFAADADIVGIEIEHVNVDALEELKRQGKRVIPDPAVLRIIQDKGLQKQFYKDHDIPTSEFTLLENGKDLSAHDHLLPAFLKSRGGGYDGKGVMQIKTSSDAEKAFDGPCMLEEQINVDVELAVLVVRSENGEVAAYDPVEMVFDPELNLVDHLRAPARKPTEILVRAKELAIRVADAFGAPGLYAVELFLSTDGRILVNETAPRAHNSGHHTIEACDSSQFDQLFRCYLEWPIGPTHLIRPAAMYNLVGVHGTGVPKLVGSQRILEIPGAFIHLYGKKETRTGRKMGHITLVGSDIEQVDNALDIAKEQCSVVPLI